MVATVGTSSTGTTISGLTPGATESFKIEAYSGSTVADSSEVSVSMPALSGLNTPQVAATALSYSVVQLSWGNVAGAEGYRIYWMNGSQAVLLGTVNSATTSVLVTGFTGGMTAQLRVEAFAGNLVADSSWSTVTTPSRPTYYGWWWWWW